MIVAEESALVKKTREYATAILEMEMPSHICYHDTQHTKDVVAACNEISKEFDLSEDQLENLLLGAWLHDTGYFAGSSDQHEEESVKIAKKFLSEQGLDEQRIEAS